MNTDSVDLIYLDPPFNSNKEYSSPIGSKAAGAAFKDTWTLSDVDLLQHNLLKKVNETLYALIYAAGRAHSKGMFSYLMMMAPRLVELKRVLKPTGSIYLHCDPTAGHYLKMLMDAIFGQHVFRNEIIWHYRTSSGAPKNHFVKNTDMLLFYAKTEDSFFNVLREPWPDRTLKKWQKDEIGIYRMNDGKKYYIDPKGKRMDNVWQITLSSRSRERTGYPTQKPLALLERIIKASSNESDLVLDPFCGCATTCVAAEMLGRNWVGIDLSSLAAQLVVQRIRERRNLFSFRDITHRDTIPVRTDLERRMAHKGTKEWTALKTRLYADQEQRCNLCHYKFEEIRHFHMDHIFPQAKGGQDWEDNFQLLCGSCNSIKGSGTQEEARARLVAKRGIDFIPFKL